MTAENGNEPNTKDIAQLAQESIQDQNGGDSAYIGNFSWMNSMANAGELAPRWWSRSRDEYLFRFFLRSNYFSSAFYKFMSKMMAIYPRVLPRNPNIKSHQNDAKDFQAKLLEGSDFGQGWQSLFSKSLLDYSVQDNGTFIEVIGEGKKDGPIVGAAMGLAPLDSSNCTRTGNWEYPVVYYDNDGSKYKLHYSRVISLSNNPPNRSNKNGVGFCWLSRCLDISQSLLDMIIYKQEKLGSRPLRQLLIGKGISATQIAGAITQAENQMSNQNLNVYSKSVVLGSSNTDIDILVRDLASVPDGFDFQTDLELGMFSIALAGGIPPRDLWPSTTTGATKADAMFQHVGGSAGYSSILDAFAVAIGGNPSTNASRYAKFLPPHLKLVFDFVDDTQDERSALISKTRSETRQRDIDDGVITIRVARQQMVEDGELSQDQFDTLELSSGRLPDGTPVLRLFNTSDEFILDLLDIGIDEPLNLSKNMGQREIILKNISDRLRYAEMVVVNTARATQRQKAEQAIAALHELRKLYEQSGENEIAEDSTEESEESDIEPLEIEKANTGKRWANRMRKSNKDEKQVNGGEDLPPEVDEYEKEMIGLIEAANSGEITQADFEVELEELTTTLIVALFLAGAEVDNQSDLDVEQRGALDEQIADGTQTIPEVSNDVYAGFYLPVDDGGKGWNIVAKATLWAVFLAGAYELGKLHNIDKAQDFQEWNITPGKDSCTDCVRLNGQIHTRREWLDSGWAPKRRRLNCKGYHCGCYFSDAEGPSRGNF